VSVFIAGMVLADEPTVTPALIVRITGVDLSPPAAIHAAPIL